MMNNNMLNVLNTLMSNPMQFLNQSGYNLPQNINDPHQIIQHLLNSGQITQEQLNQAVKMKESPMFKQMFK